MDRIVWGPGHLDYRPGSGDSLEIYDLHVDSSSRRTGIGRILVRRLVEVCEKKGIKRMYAITRAENRIAHEFYQEMNFRPTPLYDFYGVRTEKGDTTVDAIMFVRNLDLYP